MKAKVFEVILHTLPSGKSPASGLEELLNSVLRQNPNLRVLATHMSTIVALVGPNTSITWSYPDSWFSWWYCNNVKRVLESR